MSRVPVKYSLNAVPGASVRGKAIVCSPGSERIHITAPHEISPFMASVAQLVRASGCGPEGRGFESRRSPHPSLSLSDKAEIWVFIGTPTCSFTSSERGAAACRIKVAVSRAASKREMTDPTLRSPKFFQDDLPLRRAHSSIRSVRPQVLRSPYQVWTMPRVAAPLLRGRVAQ
jgi:hypothetical protein